MKHLFKDPYKSIKILLEECTYVQKVKFAVYCAEYSFHHITDNKPRTLVNKCIQLTHKWIIDPKSVSKSELNSAAYSTTAAANAAHSAASAASAAYTAAYAASAAANAAHAAANAAHAAKNKVYFNLLIHLLYILGKIKENNTYKYL